MPIPALAILDMASNRALRGISINLGALIAKSIDANHQYVASVRGLAAQLDTSVSAIQRAISELEQAGYITKQTTGGRGNTPTIFTLVPPANTSN